MNWKTAPWYGSWPIGEWVEDLPTCPTLDFLKPVRLPASVGEDAAVWLHQAHQDLEAAVYNKRGGHYSVAAFLAQQAAEKALKAKYIELHDRLWRTHDLSAMAEELDAPKTVLEACERLAPHYVSTRYPQSALDEYDEEVSDLALESAGKILDWVEGSS